jgi:uncharacterized repeat protein (TIGR01451 family)
MVEGSVTTENKVLIGDKVVATNAVTAGRQNMPGSTPILSGQFYERPPSVSFNSSPLNAFVKMENDQFKYAVIMSCGNPVKATPAAQPKQPAFEATKEVRAEGQTTWQQQARAKPGDTVEFRIRVRNTGQVDFTKVMLRDQLPADLELVDGSLRIDQQTRTNVQQSVDIGALKAGAGREVTFQARVKSDAVAEGECKSLANVAFVKPDNLAEKQASAVVQVCHEAKPKPVTPVVSKPTPPAPQPQPQPQPSALPDTGPTAIVGIFSVTSILGIALHRLKDFYLSVLSR